MMGNAVLVALHNQRRQVRALLFDDWKRRFHLRADVQLYDEATDDALAPQVTPANSVVQAH
jgi:hypothetical protein